MLLFEGFKIQIYQRQDYISSNKSSRTQTHITIWLFSFYTVDLWFWLATRRKTTHKPLISWRSLGDSNPRFRRERATPSAYRLCCRQFSFETNCGLEHARVDCSPDGIASNPRGAESKKCDRLTRSGPVVFFR